jgi:tRNA(fMet)-specific endonuclease VapC
MRKEGDRLIIEPSPPKSLLAVLATLKPLDEDFPPILSAQLDAVLTALEVVSFESPADTHYGAVRARLEKAGKPTGANDLLIAAQALTLGYTLVTDNDREFARVPGLRLENWLRKKAQ